MRGAGTVGHVQGMSPQAPSQLARPDLVHQVTYSSRGEPATAEYLNFCIVYVTSFSFISRKITRS